MKRKYIVWVLLGLLVLFTAVSCKSAPPPDIPTPPEGEAAPPPPPPPPPPQEPAPTQADLNALNEAAARAEAARKLVIDFGGDSFFPPDWQSADSLYSQAEQQKSTRTQREARDSTNRYNRAADALEALADKTLARVYDDVLNEGWAARNAATNAGALELVPDLLFDADDTAFEAGDKYDAKDYYGARDSAMNAIAMYKILKTGLDAYSVREEMENRNFIVYDPLNVELADDTMWAAADDYYYRSLAASQDKVDEALLRYNLALRTAWESYAAEKGADASTERQFALDLKANVAVRQEFNETQAVYTRANAAFQGQRFEEAANLYEECISSFEVIAVLANEKRLAAEDALERANQKMAESNEAARAAEVILEGGAR